MLSSLITDYKNDKLDSLIYDKVESHYQKYKKINIYNKNINEPLQKIWLIVPKSKLFRPVKSQSKFFRSSLPMQITIDLKNAESRKFLKFIRKLERLTLKYINKIMTDNMIMRTSVRKKTESIPPIMTMNLPCKNESFACNVFNENNSKIDINCFESCYVSSFIELSEVWIRENEFGFNWNVLQLKIYPIIDLTRCLFCDESTIDKKFIAKTANKKKESIPNSNSLYVPTVAQLLSVRLKPVKE